MRPLSDLSDREVDALVAGLDAHEWYRFEAHDGVCRYLLDSRKLRPDHSLARADATEPLYRASACACPHYTASFDEAYRVMRGMCDQEALFAELEAHSTLVDLWGWLVLKASPRDICEAMLAAVGVTEVE